MNAERIQQSKQPQNVQFMDTLHFHQKVSQKHTKNQNTKSGIGPTWYRADEATDRQF